MRKICTPPVDGKAERMQLGSDHSERRAPTAHFLNEPITRLRNIQNQKVVSKICRRGKIKKRTAGNTWIVPQVHFMRGASQGICCYEFGCRYVCSRDIIETDIGWHTALSAVMQHCITTDVHHQE